MSENINTDEAPEQKTLKERIGIYASAGIGAFFLGISDLLNHENDSTVEKIASILHKKQFFPDLQSPMWIALLILIILGIMACWVNRPRERMQGFMAGFSVFALLTVGVPQVEQPIPLNEPTDTIFPDGSTGIPSLSPAINTPEETSLFPSFFISSALANDPYAEQIAGTVKSTVLFILTDKEGKTLQQTNNFTVTLINKSKEEKERKKYRFSGNKFQITDEFGDYELHIEMTGYRNTYTYFSINNKKRTAYKLILESSILPVGLQKLMSPLKQTLSYSTYESDRLRGIDLFRIGEYEKAIQYYDKILTAQPDNAKIINYKGYALYRWGRYEEAQALLTQSILEHPSSLLLPLNLAKTYCKMEKPKEASKILFENKALSEEGKKLACNDGEFRTVCATLLQYCEKEKEPNTK